MPSNRNIVWASVCNLGPSGLQGVVIGQELTH